MLSYFNHEMPFFKGNLHCHTTLSDGAKAPDEAIALYQNNGYDFLAITDHRRVMPGKQLQNFLLLSGFEYDYIYPQGPRMACHMVGIGMKETFLYQDGLTPRQMADDIHLHGGIAILAHPAWSFMTTQAMMALPADGVEIYNTMSEVHYSRGDSAQLLDCALQQGYNLPFIASDDTHQYIKDDCESAIYVNCPTLTFKDITQAIQKRRFYAVTSRRAPVIEGIYFDGEKLICKAKNCESIAFVDDFFYTAKRVTHAPRLTDSFEAEWTLKPKANNVRVECRNAYGRAYTSFFSVSPTVVWPKD